MNPRLTHELVRGTPFEVNGRVFVPEARVTRLVAREATLGLRSTSVAGVELTRVQPSALIERTPRGERRYRIGGAAGRQVLGYIAAAAAIPLILNTLADRLCPARR